MAAIKKRKRSNGTTAYRVEWRLNGRRDGTWQSETFDTEKAAAKFARDVELADHRWPEGWVKGQGYGYVEPEPEPEPQATPLLEFAERYLETRHKIQGDTRRRYQVPGKHARRALPDRRGHRR